MSERYDVVVVGARCAGATLAFHLAQAGLSVALVDRVRFPSDTISTHFFESPGVAAMARMGLLDEVLATGAPLTYHADFRLGDVTGFERYAEGQPGDPQGPALCVRRPVLDTAVLNAAARAGADVRTGTRVTGLVSTGQRVAGVSVVDESGRETQLDAALVAGADGTGSSVARMVGARRYHAQPNQRFAYYGYFEGCTEPGPPAVFFHRLDDIICFGFPSDAGLYTTALMPNLDQLPAFGDDLEGAFAAAVARCEPLAAIMAGARRVGPLRGMANFPVFFRESAGPGWVLVGDAGHFKDPTAGQGMADAFRQAERLAAEVVAGLGGSEPPDDVLARWWAWRDANELEMHWLAADLGAAGPVPAVVVEVVRDLQASGGLWDFWGMFHHRLAPSEVLTPERFGAVAARVAGTPLEPQVMAELAFMTEAAEQRAALAASPVYVENGTRVLSSSPGR